jgi:hypothetical protein
MVSRQLEMVFGSKPGLKPAEPKAGRLRRAVWWFEQMRGAVEHARDWPPAEPEPVNRIADTACGPTLRGSVLSP